MGDISGRRRGYGEDAIYFDADKNRYIGAISLGFGPGGKHVRRKVSGKTKQGVRDKLRELHVELTAGLQPKARYTVRAAVDAWLEYGLSGRSARTVQLYRDGVQPLMDRLGSRRLGELSAGDVRAALASLTGQLSTRSLQIAHNWRCAGTTWTLTLEPWRSGVSDRAGGDTKTSRSRRTLKLPKVAVAALQERKGAQAEDQLKAGQAWKDTGLVFTTSLGTKLDQDNIRRDFRRITKAAGLGEGWVPRELRHTFVSIMSAGGVPVEEIARVAGHKQTSTTELVSRRELRSVITARAEVMDTVFLSRA
jgi:hypothetical protein